MASKLLTVQFFITFAIICIVMPTYSKLLRSANNIANDNIIPNVGLYEDELIDDSFLENSFDEMEKNIREEEYRKAITLETTDIILSDMLLDEVNCLQKIIAGEDINCSVTSRIF